MVGLAVVVWAGRLCAVDRWPWIETRALVPGALALVVVLGAVNGIAASRLGVPHRDDSEALEAVTSGVVDALPDRDGAVLLSDTAFFPGQTLTRGLVLQLERRGIDVVVRPEGAVVSTYNHLYDPDDSRPLRARFVLAIFEIDRFREAPGLALVAEWAPDPDSPPSVAVFRAGEEPASL